MRTTMFIIGDPATLRPLPDVFSRDAGPHDPPRPDDILFGSYSNPGPAIDEATRFASSDPTSHTDRLIVFILQPGPAGDWPAASAAATLWAFTRHAALAWAPRRIRVNAIGLGISPTGPWQAAEPPPPPSPATGETEWADLAATIQAMWRWPSMTGQLIRLGA